MGWFWDEYQANVREYRRTWKRRLLRRVVAILLVILITPIAMLVRHVTGSNAAGAIVGVPLLVFAVFFWWWIEDRLYADADARYFAELDAQEAAQQGYQQPTEAYYAAPPGYQPQMPQVPPGYDQPIAATLVPEHQQPHYLPAPSQAMVHPGATRYQAPPKPSGGGGWGIVALVTVLTVMLMCGGVVGGGVLMVSRAAQRQRQNFAGPQDRMAEIQQRHQEQMREFERRNQEMRERMERDRERMRRPGW